MKWINKSFKNTIAKKYKNIQHYGCYFHFHFLQRCRSKLISEGLGTEDNSDLYEKAMEFTSNIPFKES